MGLDMFIFKYQRFEDATPDDVDAVEFYLDLKAYNAKHPEKKYTMKQWCGKNKPSDKLIRFYSKFKKETEYGSVRVKEEVAYWRKANAIHKWFVDHVQNGEDDCEYHRELTKEDLIELKDTAEMVIKYPDLAEKLLPTKSGFFFGGTGYDKWYFEDLEYTVNQIKKILEETDFETEMLYYVSSW